MTTLSEQLQQLAQWDTPTICNALELVAAHRRGYGYSTRAFSCLHPEAAPIVGRARTAKIRASSPDLSGSNQSMADRLAYYEYIAAADVSTIVVIEDVDPHPGVGAFWGEVNTALHKGLGALGVVTNGSYRDVADSAAGFQVLAGQVGPSHAFVHPVEYGQPVTVHGMQVQHDDFIHADRHGAVVIPADVLASLPDAVEEMGKREAPILKAARSDDFNIDKLRQMLSGKDEIH